MCENFSLTEAMNECFNKDKLVHNGRRTGELQLRMGYTNSYPQLNRFEWSNK